MSQTCPSLLKYLAYPNRGDAHADDNALLGKSREVGSQAEVSSVVGEQHTVAHGTQGLDALNERLFLNAAVPVGPVQQISTLQPQLHQSQHAHP